MTEAEYLGSEEDFYDPEGDIDNDVEQPKFSTQVLHPWRATLRTIIASLVALVPLLQALPAVLQELAGVPMPDDLSAWLLAASAALAAGAGAVTRIMAIPQVATWLEYIGAGTGVLEKHDNELKPQGREQAMA